MPDIVLDYHRLKTPIDHPDQSVTRSKLEVPTSNVNFAYLACINKVRGCAWINSSYFVLADWVFTDKSIFAFEQVNQVASITGRLSDYNHLYRHGFDPNGNTSDHYIDLWNGTTSGTILATEAIDIDNTGRGGRLSISGSAIKGMRYELQTPTHALSLPSPNATISATDTTLASGYYGARMLRHASNHSGTDPASAWLLNPASTLPPALAIIETEIIKGIDEEEPTRPELSKSLVDIGALDLPLHLRIEAKKYEMLVKKGFTEEEMRLLLGYVPQHQVDLDAVTWGSFEFHPDKASTVIVVITGDNPYSPGAVERQKTKAKRAFRAPKNYEESVELYKQLNRDYPHWLAGKDNFVYQTIGLELFDLFQNVDFYYGELVEHRTHYNQLKQVHELELWHRLDSLEDMLQRMSGLAGVLANERDKHINKVRDIKKLGW